MKFHHKLSIRVSVVFALVLLTLLMVSIAIGLQYYFNRKMATESALAQYQLSAAATRDYLQSIDKQTVQLTKILSRYPGIIQENWVHPNARLLFSEVLETAPLLYAIYIGFANGDFYELVNLKTHPDVRSLLNAAPDDRWVEITVKKKGPQRFRQFDYFSEAFDLRTTFNEPSDYDPRKRLWFTHATEQSVHKTRPYLFQHLQSPGQTYAIQMPGTRAVLALDITFLSLSEYVGTLPLSRESEIYLFQANGQIHASNQAIGFEQPETEIEPITLTVEEQTLIKKTGTIKISNEMDWPPLDFAVAGEPQGYAIDLIHLLARMTGLKIEFINGYTWPELLEQFKNGDIDVIHPVVRNETNQEIGVFSDPLITLPQAVVTRPGPDPITSLDQLEGKTLAIPEGWSSIPIIEKNFPAIVIVRTGSTREALQQVSRGQVFAALDMGMILRYTARQYFIDNLQFHENLPSSETRLPQELHLLIHPRHKGLVPILNKALAGISDHHRQALKEKWLSPGHETTGTSSQPHATVPYSRLIEIAGQETLENQLHKTILKEEDHFVFVTPLEQGSSYQEYFAVVVPGRQLLAGCLEKLKTSILITIACMILLLPVCWLFAVPIVNPIKRLAAENRKIKHRHYDQVTLCRSSIKEIHELAVSLVDMSDAIQQYEQQQANLMDAFIQTISRAIDDKSPYTGRHCARVPELALMIAKAADQSSDPPFHHFSFDSEDELREFRIAAWLHDCGKILTPEHIINKGTKLEALYNRIHEIRTRFEILWRDAEITALKKQVAAPEKTRQWQAELAGRQKALREDFAFIAQTNTGNAPLSESDIQRLTALSRITWQRHFDDRLGLSPMEARQMAGQESELPATETLLSDKPIHQIPHPIMPEFDPDMGIKMAPPEYLQNLGELYNLSTPSGTLTAEDRYKIDEHVIGTIRLLEKLPFPAEMARIPRYASTHHEVLNGTGYPRQLTAEDLSIPERIIAIADIFEALTASDRPYKQAKRISDALSILQDMVQKNKIDPDVFALFITSGVCMEYARRHLSPDLIDITDVNRYLKSCN
jgi:HD-GYP domain-containing protein (c-di-GMP phosphodiesterase class II)/ABC-type amino acid transport substrate-binding protein